MSSLFSQLNGFNQKYAENKNNSFSMEIDETDYSEVDYCQGTEQEYAEDYSIFGEQTEQNNYKANQNKHGHGFMVDG